MVLIGRYDYIRTCNNSAYETDSNLFVCSACGGFL